MNTRFKILILAVGLIILDSCKKEYLSTGYVDPTIPVSYSAQINPIWTASCLGSGCHAGSMPPNLTADKSYNSLKTGNYIDTAIVVPENTELWKYLNGLSGYSPMPPSGKLDATKLNLIKTWIMQGSKNN